MSMDKETIRKAVEESKNDDFFQDFASFYPNDIRAVLIQNAPTWLRELLSENDRKDGEIESLRAELANKSKIIGGLSDDLAQVSIEWADERERQDGEIQRIKEERDSWRRVAEKLEYEKVDARRERDKAQQANAAMLEGLQGIWQLTNCIESPWTTLTDISAKARLLLAQYDTDQPTAQGEADE